MRTTFSHRFVAVIAAAAITVGVQALVPHAGAGTVGRPAGDTVVQKAVGTAAQAAAVRYWTAARMAAALRAANSGQPTAGNPLSKVRRLVRKAPPLRRAVSVPARSGPRPPANTAGDGLAWTYGGAVAAAVGKIFFTLSGEDYVCSGALIRGERVDLVLTAAHCVTGGPSHVGAQPSTVPSSTVPSSTVPSSTGQWATNWVFVPGFRNGLEPYGEYTAHRFFVIPGWTGPEGGKEQYDVAFVQVTTATLYGASGAAVPPPGLPVQFAAKQDPTPLSPAFIFGYPAQPPYGGLNLSYCAGLAGASGGSMRTPCEMTAGDSGGPWLAGFGTRPGSGKVVAVSTYKFSDDLRVLYGAVLGPQARALYERAVSSAR